MYEPKWDGFRAIVTLAGGEASLTSRNGNDLTGRFREAARAAQLEIRAPDAVLDGEICALDEQGRSRFSLLQSRGGALVLVLFDLLELDSEPLVDLPLVERRERLAGLVDAAAGTCSSRRSSTTATRSSRRGGAAASRVSSRSGRTRATSREPELGLAQA